MDNCTNVGPKCYELLNDKKCWNYIKKIILSYII